ncbi:MAG: RHS repeat-associated core domain-containing protein [Candidatus Scalindua sp.]|nr:RHS repeat-associated core domain-containing protein [Candidatus Scalindua sp.]
MSEIPTTSQELDSETGLYYYGARCYDPLLVRFTTADPIVPDPTNPQSLNRYSYVLNNPLKYIDPAGHGFLDLFKDLLSSTTDVISDTVQSVEIFFNIGSVVATGTDGTQNPYYNPGQITTLTKQAVSNYGRTPINASSYGCSSFEGGDDYENNSLQIGSTRTYLYNGQDSLTASKLYIQILIGKAAEQFGIKDVAASTAILTGAPLIPKRFNTPGSTKGTSVASKFLSKISGSIPVGLPTITGFPRILGGNRLRVSLTTAVGRFAGRTVPIVGWGVLAYDVGMTFYMTQVEFNRITKGEE